MSMSNAELDRPAFARVLAAIGCVSAALLMIGNFVADVLLAWSDPRIRLE